MTKRTRMNSELRIFPKNQNQKRGVAQARGGRVTSFGAREKNTNQMIPWVITLILFANSMNH